jgi:hypothetical protein
LQACTFGEKLYECPQPDFRHSRSALPYLPRLVFLLDQSFRRSPAYRHSRRNEVIVSSRIAGRIQKLTVDEGDTVQAGQLIATIQSDDLAAARNAAEATATSQHYLLQQARDTERQLGGSTASQVAMQKRKCMPRKLRSFRHRRS